MPTFRQDVNLGHKVPLVEHDDISKDAIDSTKIGDRSVTLAKLANDVMEYMSNLCDTVKAWCTEMFDILSSRINMLAGRIERLESNHPQQQEEGGAGSCGCPPIVILTQSEYDALSEKDAGTLYFIREGWVFGNSFPIILS